MRRLLQLLLLVILVSSVACSGSNPVSPSAFPSGGLDAKAEKPANINGVVSDVGGTADAFQFLVGTTPVRGDADTEFFGESVFAHLASGVRVEVKGVVRPDHVYANRIHINSREVSDSGDAGGTPPPPPPPPPPPACSWPVTDVPDTTFPTAPRFGQIYLSSMTGTEPNLVIGGAGRPVYTTATTVVRRNTDLLPMWILRPGLLIEVFGSWTSTQIDAAEVNLNGLYGGTLDVNAEGAASLVIGDYPEVRFVVGTSTFLANEWTKFSGSPCDVLVEGAALRLRGVKMADGVTVLATYVERVVQ